MEPAQSNGIVGEVKSGSLCGIPYAEARALILFLLVGGIGLCLTLSITYALTSFAHLWYLFSFIIAAFITWTFVFFANTFLTFKNQKPASIKGYLTFMSSYLAIFWINGGIVYVLTSLLSIPYTISIIIGTVVTTLFTFVLSRFFIFSPSKKKTEDRSSQDAR